jgi:hypothetical protein
MKVLNLDKLVPVENRVLQIGEESYPVLPVTVANFIETTRAAEKVAADASVADQIETAIDMVLRSVPTVPRETLLRLSMEQLHLIVTFVRGDPVEGIDGATRDDTDKGDDAGNG